MRDNPYAPPKSEPLHEVVELKKPIAVWLFQILASALAVTLLLGIGRTLFLDLSTYGWRTSLISVAWRAVALSILVFGVIGSQRRALYGRVLGILFLALLGTATTLNQLISTYRSKEDLFTSIGTAKAVGEMFGLFIVLGLFWWWLYAFGLSAKARGYFRGGKKAPRAAEA